MKIKKGTLVACDAYGFEDGVISTPNQKRAIGIVIGKVEDDQDIHAENSFQVTLIHPPNLRKTIGVLESDLMALAQTSPADQNAILDNLPDIFLALVRKSDEQEKKIR